MTGILALAALGWQTPVDLNLAYEKAIPLQDDLVSQLPRPRTRDLVGAMIADDGSAIFHAKGKIIRIKMGDYQYISDFPIWQREWEAGPPVTDPQKGWMSTQSGKIDPKKHLFKALDAHTIVRADTEDRFWTLHDNGEEIAISGISLAYAAPDGNKAIAGTADGKFPVSAIPDLSSDAVLGLMQNVSDQKVLEHRLLNTSTAGTIKSVPGISPFRYDSALDLILCFTFSESGFPASMIIQHLKGEGRDTLPRPSGEMSVTALLPKGRVIATFTNRLGDDAENPKLGLYELAPPYKEAKYLGPYRLVGSSRNGKWLAVQHRYLRKAWLLLTK